MFQKMHVAEPDNWQSIEEEQALRELGRYYRNVPELIDCMKIGGKARTPFAFYRWSMASAPSSMQSAGKVNS